MIKKITIAVLAAFAAVAIPLGGLALANTFTPFPAGTIHGCVNLKAHRTLDNVYTNPNNGLANCPAGQFRVVWNQQGPQGSIGPSGPAGPSGPPATLPGTVNVIPSPSASVLKCTSDGKTPPTFSCAPASS